MIRMEPQGHYPYYVANRPEQPNADLTVADKYTGQTVARVALADAATIDRAIGQAVAAAQTMAEMAPYERRAILKHCVERFRSHADELAEMLCIEAGKPIRDSHGEVSRLIDTFSIAAEETTRIGGEVLNLEISPRARGYRGMYRRYPVGPCSFITPFNFPLNLAAHKIAPAIAAGCPFVLKPASLTPIGALMIGQALAETDLPSGAFSILPCHREGADLFTTDERLKLLSFTGSSAVGWDLKARAGKKKVVLELGGNAACIVDEDADVSDAVDRIVLGAFYQSGQSCISVQRILAHDAIYDDLTHRLVAAASALGVGDPKSTDTFIGPLIKEEEAIRLEKWITDAVKSGARVLCGGKRDGAVLHPTLLENVPAELSLCAEEAFGPVAVLERFKDFDLALESANASRYGLQAGVFTSNIHKIHRAWDRLEAGGVMINEAPSWRVDNMPYGGVKESGIGREGVRYAIEDMTEIRMLVIRTPADEGAN